MEKKVFFSNYIPALEQALNYEQKFDFEVVGPDMFISDIVVRNSLDEFENENYFEFKKLFNLVSNYFDARTHNFQNVDGKNIAIIKEEILEEIEKIKKIYF
ncbi:hypothetical protein [Flavobacterium phragmitis]|uniref:Uncharacterized protein n=1 Tax=Flavobacterium phragmitis TaxID=739143 RepID=A0A1I1SMH2_9FLAO|nr:hypothetical protein [Flavobacterium phragmitis]SFD47512.1 hypothetical protein SAMN05216297_108117 [Flavobacterium phragmitis]